jgi:succinate dehydrogenase/fumarate reductase flavoprotein subunit
MSDDLFDFDADVLVVGTGGAGFAAAVSAALEGASVVMFERNDHIGGTTGASGGTVWIPNNGALRAQGKEDPRESALRYMCRMAYPQYFYAGHPTMGLPAAAYELLETFYDSGSVAIDRLTGAGVLDLMADTRPPDPDNPVQVYTGHWLAGFPDYGGDDMGNELPTGRHLFPMPDGPGVLEQFEAGAARLGVRIALEHQVTSVLRNDDGEVVGLQLRRGHQAVLARARKAVIFASGGYAHNPELIERYLPGRIFGTCATLGAKGDFVNIGIELGAALGNMKNAWYKQVPIEPALRMPTPPGVWLPWGDAMVQVNKYGRRVVNEKMAYHDRSQAHFVYDPTRREYPNLVLFHIFDESVRSSDSMVGMRHPFPDPGEPDPSFLISGDTWEDLAARVDAQLAEWGDRIAGTRLDPSFTENLKLTIERFDGFARTGKDLDFRRGETPVEWSWSGPNRPGSPNPTMAPFADQGPYHCMIVGAAVLDTNGGPIINTRAQVVDAQGEPIPGLYGAGNCVASPAGQAYWGPGATIGLGITYGYLAGLSAAAEREKRFEA